jgi:hypothetical protein
VSASSTALSGEAPRRAPFLLRALIALLSAAAFLLTLWLLGFVLRDLGHLEMPDRAALEAEQVSAEDLGLLQGQSSELRQVESDLSRQGELQSGLRASIHSARGTIDQMLAIRRLALEKGLAWAEAEQQALATAQERFLDSQEQLDASLDRTAALEQRRHELRGGIAELEARLARQRQPADAAYRDALRAREFKAAAAKLAFLLPVFLVAAWFVARRRGSLYRPLHLAVLLAATWQLGAVIHEHFPAEFFKYLALGAGLAVTVAFLVALLRNASQPSGAVLLKRNREGYRKGECPQCAFPIAGGPEQGPATCPSCGLDLFHPCAACGATRHSQLPHCLSCGTA